MANILYRGAAVPTVANTAGANNAPLTNDQIDKNLYALNTDKLDKVTTTAQTVASDVTFSGNVTINGTTTTISSTTISVNDINIELGKVTTPTDTTANGGGITLKGATDKTIIWDSTNTNWTSSEHWNIATGKSYKINNVAVLSSTALGTTVVSSSLTKLGTAAGFIKSDASGNLTVDNSTHVTTSDTGTVTNTMLAGSIANTKLVNSTISGVALGSTLNTLTLNVTGTGLSGSATYNGSALSTFTVTSNATNANTASTIVARDASGNFSAGTITATLAGSAASWTTARTLSLTGDATGSMSVDGSVNASAAVTLADTGVTPGAYGSATAIPVITVDSKGRVTSVSTNAVSIGSYSQYTGTTGPTWGSNYSTISASGVSEVGRYIDFHGASADAVDYTVRLDGGGAGSTTLSLTGSFTASGDITATSDARSKSNVVTIESALEKTLQLRGVSYTKDGKVGIGVIAQEIQKILPQVVVEADDDQKTLSVAYGNIVGLLIESIKELNSKIEDLQNQLNNK